MRNEQKNNERKLKRFYERKAYFHEKSQHNLLSFDRLSSFFSSSHFRSFFPCFFFLWIPEPFASFVFILLVGDCFNSIFRQERTINTQMHTHTCKHIHTVKCAISYKDMREGNNHLTIGHTHHRHFDNLIDASPFSFVFLVAFRFLVLSESFNDVIQSLYWMILIYDGRWSVFFVGPTFMCIKHS